MEQEGSPGDTSNPQGADDDNQTGATGNNASKRDKKDDAKEEILVKQWMKRYEHARKFDENYRKQIAIDRRYAAGTSDQSWAVSTNVIGSLIDVLVALLYARDPDVSVRKSPQVSNIGTLPMEKMARTLEIVISRLWKDGKLKRKCKKNVRSVLSVAEGWLKATMVSEKEPNAELETALNDARETMEHLEACERLLEDPQGMSEDEITAQKEERHPMSPMPDHVSFYETD